MQNSYSLHNTLPNLTANAVRLSHTKHCSLHGNQSVHGNDLAVFAVRRAVELCCEVDLGSAPVLLPPFQSWVLVSAEVLLTEVVGSNGMDLRCQDVHLRQRKEVRW